MSEDILDGKSYAFVIRPYYYNYNDWYHCPDLYYESAMYFDSNTNSKNDNKDTTKINSIKSTNIEYYNLAIIIIILLVLIYSIVSK